MNPPIWIAICGQVRNLFELAYTLHVAIGARRRGIVEGVVLSTWLGEREKARKLFEAAENDGVFIVESLAPPEWAPQPPHRTSSLNQMLTLHRALEIIPNDAYVLKTRTDLIPDCIQFFLSILENPDQLIGREALLNKERLTALHINNVLFFDICDTQFFSHREKLSNILGFSVFADTMADTNPWHFVSEARFLGQKCLYSSKRLSFVSSIVTIMQFIQLPGFLISAGITNIPRILIETFAEYYAFLLQEFQLVFQGTAPKGEFRFADLFTPNGRLCEDTYRPGCALIRFDAKLRFLANAVPDENDPNAIRFLERLHARLSACGKAPEDRLEPQDVEELIAFDAALPGERRFLALPADAVRARVPQPKQGRSFDFREALALPQPEFSAVFFREIERGSRIDHAAYETFQAARQRAPDKSEEVRFWLELAAHYGHRAAQEQADFPDLDFSALRQRREGWLDQIFPKA